MLRYLDNFEKDDKLFHSKTDSEQSFRLLYLKI